MTLKWNIAYFLILIIIIVVTLVFVFQYNDNQSNHNYLNYTKRQQQDQAFNIIHQKAILNAKTITDPYFHQATAKELVLARKNHDEVFALCGTIDFLPGFNAALYNDSKYISINACYCYAFHMMNKTKHHKLQPGEISGHRPLTKKELTLEHLINRVLMDHPTAVWISCDSAQFTEPASCQSWKVYLLLNDWEKIGHRDYHFVQQNVYAYSHKPGRSAVQIVDASGNYILNPNDANWDYSQYRGINYGKPRGFFQVFHDSTYVLETNDHLSILPSLETFPEMITKNEI